MAQGFYERVGFCLRPTQVEVFCDSQSDIALSRNTVLQKRTNHVDVKYNFVRELVSEKIINVVKIASQYNPANILPRFY